MATSAADTSTPNSALNDRFIADQLDKTRAYVKTADFFTSLMTLLAGIFAFLLAVVVVDAWVVELNFWARLGALGILAGGSIAYFLLAAFPLLIRRINPAYAARAIEQSEPSLKNSLINFLSFRSHREGLHDVVYEALQQQAAADLKHAPLDSAIDRSRLLKIGYLLAGVIVACALYTILSPKKPFSTLQRIVAPLADISRPSIVAIKEVDPGDADVFDGQQLRVTANISGLADDQPVTLFYSTADGQTVDAPVPMKVADDGYRRTCLLPPGEDGVRQDMRYYIQAGDAHTRQFDVTMIPAPIITVQSLHYDYPSYTRQADLVVEDQGDIKALEGTRVTVRAAANQDIKHAYIEFDTHLSKDDRKHDHKPLSMSASGREATGSFVLELEDDGFTPKRSSYQVRFMTKGGHASQKPTIHSIEVTRDLRPEIEILTPKSTLVKVPVDGRQMIEARAIDPDFGVSKIRLHATVSGDVLFDGKTLVEDAAGRTGQVVANYEVLPAALGLKPGDKVVYWARVEDNRTSPLGGHPAPNSSRTENYQIEIVAAKESASDDTEDKAPSKPEDKPRAKDPSEANKSEMGEGDKGGDSSTAGSKSEDKSDDGEPGMEESGSGDGKGQGGGESSDKRAGNETGEADGGKSDMPDEGDGGKSDAPGEGNAENTSGEPGEGNQGGRSDGQAAGEPSRNEKLHDGEVFERALKHQQENSKGKGGSDKTGESQDAAAPGDQESKGGNPADKKSEPGGSQQQDMPGGSGSQQNQDSPNGSGQRPQGPSGDKGAQQKPEQGDASKGDTPAQTPTDGGRQQPDGGSPDAQGQNKPRGDNPRGSNQPESDAQSPSNSNHQSKSQGDQQGDKSGAGKQGGGQDSPQPGRNKPGSSTPSEDGKGTSNEPGKGQTGKQPGSQDKAEGQTGKSSGDRPGKGSQSTKGGEKSGAGDEGAGKLPDQKQNQNAEAQQDGDENQNKNQQRDAAGKRKPSEGAKGDERAGDDKRDEGAESGGSKSEGDAKGADSRSGSAPPSEKPSGGGKPADGTGGSGDSRENKVDEDLAPADKAKLEYTRKATNLALEYLKDQRNKPDPELLDKLNMTKEELQQFVERWSKMKQIASEDTASGKDYDEALRSLGLRPSADKRRAVNARKDSQRGPDSGSRSKPPPSFIEKFRAFKSGQRDD